MYVRRFYFCIIWLPCVVFSLDPKVLKPLHGFMAKQHFLRVHLPSVLSGLGR